MKFRVGSCNNDMFCSLASGFHPISVPADGNFVCPQCSKPLVAAAHAQRSSPLIVGALAGGGLALAGSGLFAAGAFMGSGTAAQMPPGHADPAAPAVALQLAMTEIRSTAQPAAAADQSGMTANVAPQTAAPRPASAIAPTVAVVVSLGERRLADASPALISGTGIVALAATVAPQHLVLPPPPDTPASHQAVVSAAARAASKSVAEQSRREQRAAGQASQTEDQRRDDARDKPARPAADAQPAPVKTAPPAVQVEAAGVWRQFAAVAVSGGAPDYPDTYDDSNRSGRVTVSCRIERDGSPHNCSVVKTKGGAAFGKSVLKWLASGRVRYQPAMRNGAPVAETQQWTVNFVP